MLSAFNFLHKKGGEETKFKPPEAPPMPEAPGNAMNPPAENISMEEVPMPPPVEMGNVEPPLPEAEMPAVPESSNNDQIKDAISADEIPIPEADEDKQKPVEVPQSSPEIPASEGSIEEPINFELPDFEEQDLDVEAEAGAQAASDSAENSIFKTPEPIPVDIPPEEKPKSSNIVKDHYLKVAQLRDVISGISEMKVCINECGTILSESVETEKNKLAFYETFQTLSETCQTNLMKIDGLVYKEAILR